MPTSRIRLNAALAAYCPRCSFNSVLNLIVSVKLSIPSIQHMIVASNMHSSPHLASGSGSRFANPANLNPNILSVRFGFGEALNLNRTERTVRVGSGSGSGIFPNRTDGPVQGLEKFTPEPDRTEPRQH